MARKQVGDIAAARRSSEELAAAFEDVAPPLNRQRALIESQRCYYCYDAPCITACPTGIDIPGFIRSISTDNLRGAAETILSANIFGGICARVCPTEILCEGVCVRNTDEDKPVEISALQRYGTDWVFEENAALFQRASDSGKKIAVVGAGPAGLACAHALSLRGHQVQVFDRQPKAGGLNEYGIAAYKVPDFAQREIQWLLSIGGIEIVSDRELGKNLSLAELRAEYDAVFLGMGLAGVNALGIEGEQLSGVANAVDMIAQLRQCEDLQQMPVGRRVVIIGGGNTAVDAAVQSKKLGAEWVYMVYRRGAASMSATAHEQAFVKEQGVHVIEWAQPSRFIGVDGKLSAVEFEYTEADANGKARGSGEHFTLDADVALKAIGQVLVSAPLQAGQHEVLATKGGRIVVDSNYATSLSKVWAGGDCVGGKVDLTVQAVEDGKRAAQAIDRFLATEKTHG
ncbi:NAD(P)-dependent oxidoreductase [Pseudomarimonas arenosa]|uniref:dihydrouracil dehydrogenase (NAD(+)) n=1 Tax=Pseudomarimonas arenosa TaxID=2774145 RepID=A0AAW3ZNR9_9GAMM|nr:NAD(P)-dependent oxidoreductase [Pseudomarimonas arenosa]MBD8526570.1 NAD(P)-dependent oxidoreductase [Pseudomarimonas arenosa]